MLKTFKSIMFVAAVAMAFTACNVEPVEAPEETVGTHKVSFVASQLDTKTTMDINNGVASFDWEEADKAYFHIFENGVGAASDDIEANLDNGVMNISAMFPDSSAPYTYTGFMAATVSNDNPAVNKEQIVLGAYDPESDILVAKPVTDKTPEDILEGILFQFKRVVAINQMTLKGLTEGETVSEVTITSDKPIAGEYDFANGAWNASETSISIVAEAEVNADGQAVVYFVSAPVVDALLTVTATTAAGKTYSKELAKTISFTEGGVKTFGVTVVEEGGSTAEPINLLIDFKTTVPAGWPTKANAAEGTYSYSVDGVSYSFTHTKVGDGIYCGGTIPTSGYLMVVSGNKLGLPAIEGYKLTKVVGTLNDSGSPSTSVKVFITDGSFDVSGGEEQQWSTKGASYTYTLSDTEANTVYYLSVNSKNLQMITLALTYEPSNGPTVTKYSVVCEEVTGGTLSASPARAEADAVVTLTATPDEEYTFNNDWAVVDANENPVAVTDSQFSMPACDVSVSGSFTKKTYAITKNEADNGTFTIKLGDDEVTSASKGDHLTLSCEASEGYILDNYSVVKTNDGQTIAVNDNAFYMPGEPVTVSATFKEIVVITYEGSGTEDDPYTVDDIYKYIDNLGGHTSSEVYVKGTVCQVDSYNSKYSSITYWIGTDSKKFEIYGGLGMSDHPFTSKDDLSVGDVVVVKGTPKKYNNTYEFDSNSVLVSLVEAPYLKATASKTSGILAEGETITITVDTNIDSWSASITGDPTFALDQDNKTATTIPVIVSENTDVVNGKTATVTITAGDKKVEIKLTQLVKIEGGQGGTIASGTVLWAENFDHFGTNTPSAAGTGSGTTIYGGATVKYSQSSTNTKGYDDTLAGGTAPELLLSKSSQTWTISGICCDGASAMSLTFLANKTTFSVTSLTNGISISGKEKSWTIENNGAKTFEITIKNTGSSNARIDDVILKVK